MTTFKHILVPTDFQGASSSALNVAVNLAKKHDARVTLLHVWEIPVYPYLDFMLASDVVSSVEDAATKGLSRAVTELRKEFPGAESQLRTGEAWQQIQDAIRELGADLVVMGTHARRGLSHLMLGSVAEKTVRLSPVPVLTVHE
ncbi:MAG: UspA domain protein [Polyangiaceae bacterium]|jgi:nucleotide-binding universal stress UspA family protein|nr:UspA domain protein [Polyangiaceae bacterium]